MSFRTATSFIFYSMYKYYKFYKPYGVLSQFTQEVKGHRTLQDFLAVEKDVYPVGRLDKDSEGLLLLTNERSLTQTILSPDENHRKTYWVQVEGEATKALCSNLCSPHIIRTKKKTHQVRALKCELLSSSPLPERKPPIRERKHIPTSWIAISLDEGKHRQVRKMCAHFGFPVLRLCRWSIEDISLQDLQPGDYRELSETEFKGLLHLDT